MGVPLLASQEGYPGKHVEAPFMGAARGGFLEARQVKITGARLGVPSGLAATEVELKEKTKNGMMRQMRPFMDRETWGGTL